MEKQNGFTEAQVSILLWMKALNDLTDSTGQTFTELYNAFEEIDETGFTSEEYIDTVDFWAECGILKEEEKGYSVTEAGEKLFKKLDEMGGKDDETIRKKLNNAKNTKERGEAIKGFIKKYSPEIKELLFSLVDVALKHL